MMSTLRRWQAGILSPASVRDHVELELHVIVGKVYKAKQLISAECTQESN